MTWNELKKLIDETEGITGDSEIDYIDIAPHRPAPIEVVTDEESGQFWVWN
jgi:hypothetical protein